MLSGDLPSKMTISMSKRPMKDQLVKLIMAAKDHFKTRQSPSLKNILKVIPKINDGRLPMFPCPTMKRDFRMTSL
jgi:hypothetical protein